eukprot:g5000.t1
MAETQPSMTEEEEDDAWPMGGGMCDADEEEDAREREELARKRGFSEAELASCLKVLKALQADLPSFKKDATLKPLRACMIPFLDDVRGRLYDGKSSDVYERAKYNKKQANLRKTQLINLDRGHINKTHLRSSRLEQLNALCAQDEAFPQVPDGAAEEPVRAIEGGAVGGAIESGAGAGAGGEAEPGAEEAEASAQAGPAGGGGGGGAPVRLQRPRSCYQCKRRFVELHRFYDQLCPACAALNYEKRHLTADLAGRVALVTGARVKIGFQIVLKLLRAGATVVATTRFPQDAARRYAEVADYDAWRGRLHVHGLDLRDVVRLEGFCAFLNGSLPRLDIIVNNACQTIRRPPTYYRHLLEAEAAPPAKALQPLLAQQAEREASVAAPRQLEGEGGGDSGGGGGGCGRAGAATISAAPTPAPTATSALALVAGDEAEGGAQFPQGSLDVNAQQLDLRTQNSWLLSLEQVSTPELVEVFAINAISPFVLNARLEPLLSRGAMRDVDKYVINVSAMEGKFYRYKTPHHPHTNMAKAALNMMTRTAAEELSKRNIFMNAVDTGWINDENPRDKAAGIAERHNFQTPLDEVDAAARVLEPVFTGVNGGERVFGKFLKDYRETEW